MIPVTVYGMYYRSLFKILLIEIVSVFSIDIASTCIACSSRYSLSQNAAKMYGHHSPITEGVIYGLWTSEILGPLLVKRMHQ